MGRSTLLAGRKINDPESGSERGIIVATFGGSAQTNSEFNRDDELGISIFSDINMLFQVTGFVWANRSAGGM